MIGMGGEIPDDVQTARAILEGGHEPETTYRLRGLLLARVACGRNVWDVYKELPDDEHEYVDRINAGAIKTANQLVDVLGRYPGSESGGSVGRIG